jgi:hypothetical protein
MTNKLPHVDSDAWLANSDLAKLVNEIETDNSPRARALRFFRRLVAFILRSKP